MSLTPSQNNIKMNREPCLTVFNGFEKALRHDTDECCTDPL